LTSFAELEQKIATLPDEKTRGDAFEVFAEAYLATQRKHDAAHVWPHDSVPLDILKSLGLTQQDQGVDGVLQTLLGQFDAYQVKFRTGRPSLTWRELSTFIGLADSPRIHSRVLLTNCDELPSVLNDRQGFFCIRGADLDRMEADDFRAIEAWLADAAYIAPKKTPKDHQTEALDALLPALQTHGRVSAIMACGTGKTLVALWVMERLQAKRVLVLLPSLALLRQTLHVWLRETNLPNLAYLCVCSDRSVKEGLDMLKTEQSDLDFEVTTDAATVRSFLDAPFAGVKLIFSTYQSARRVVGEALKPGECFDFAVFDEAHKTAGREGRNFAFALDDKNLSIRKRLFLTATPRHYNPSQRNKEGDAKLVFSMDKTDVYGPQSFRLPFAEAARRKIICRYKVIISHITTEMVTNELLKRGEVLIGGDPVHARQVANQIALCDAVEKFGVKKIFTFHSSISSAASFVADGNEGVRVHLPDFQTFHVNGNMPTAKREHVMRDFRDAPRAVMSNARCLTEGVDVPAVDMVAFLSPRRSRVDIVQATGRAMRIAPNKNCGYVIVPLYVEQAAGETIEQAVARAEYDDVWDVLQSLQEQDEMLAEIIRDMRLQRGRKRGYDDTRFRERVEILGPEITFENLRRSIIASCVNVLGESWHERYGQLVSYYEKYGNSNVPRTYKESRTLAGWVIRQRVLYKRKVLDEEKISLLNQIGFIWNPVDAIWNENYLELIKYYHRFGHCRVTQDWKENKTLGKWVSTQRVYYNRGWLPQERMALLEKLNFDWAGGKVTWEMRFAELKAFKEQFKHTRVPVRWKKNRLLGLWVSDQRHKKRHGEINKEHEALLNSIGFEWEVMVGGAQTKFWDRQIEAILQFKSKHGHFVVPRSEKKYTNLAVWMSDKRAKFKNGKINKELKARLDSIGFPWVTEVWKAYYDKHWQKMFEQLKEYISNHGNPNIVVTDNETAKLKGWVKSQKDARKRNHLSQEKIDALDRVGFLWAKLRKTVAVRYQWQEMFDQFKNYMSIHANPDIVVTDDATAPLKAWVKSQKDTRRRKHLSQERIEALDRVGFLWPKPRKIIAVRFQWQTMFEQFKEYMAVHANPNIIVTDDATAQLKAWVKSQKYSRRRKRLSQEKIDALDRVGFVWAKPRKKTGVQ